MATLPKSPIQVVLLTTDLQPQVADFLKSQPAATVFHEPWWFTVLRDTYAHRCEYWIALEGERVVGVFPVVLLSLPLLGSKMVALPYQYHCGAPLAVSEQALQALLGNVQARARASNARYFEVRSDRELPVLAEYGFSPIETELCKTVVSLKDFDLKTLREGHRQGIKKAGMAGVRIQLDPTLRGLRSFWQLYRLEGRLLAGPRPGWKFFDSLYRNAGACYRLWLAHEGSDCIGGVLTLDNGVSVFARHGAYTNPRAAATRLSAAILWESMFDAASRGCTSYDLGISWIGDEGLIRFKEGWRGKTQPVMAYVLPLQSDAPRPGGYFEGYRLAKAIWRKLPMPIVDVLSHQVTRWIG